MNWKRFSLNFTVFFLLAFAALLVQHRMIDRWYAKHWTACWKWNEDKPPFPIPSAAGWQFKCYWLPEGAKVSIGALPDPGANK